jgi:hypothetical protein
MKTYSITEQQINFILSKVQALPYVNVFETINTLTSLPVVSETVEAPAEEPKAEPEAHDQHIFTNNAETCDVENCNEPNPNTVPEAA